MRQVYIQSLTFDPKYINENWSPAIHLRAGTSQCLPTATSTVTDPCAQARPGQRCHMGVVEALPSAFFLCHFANDNLEP